MPHNSYVSLKMTAVNLTPVIFLYLCICLVSTNFDKKLKYYEILDEIHVHSREARSPDVSQNAPHCKKNLRLYAMGRNFSVHLTQSRKELFSKNFQMKIVHEDGSWDAGALDVNNFCSGVLEGEDKSEVIAYFDGDGSLASAKISTLHDDFLIEVNVIDQANKIYKTTEFFSGDTGYGLEIDELRIHDGYTATASGSLHYNMNKRDWQIQQLLDKYCLAHLFTHESFTNNVMGLAYIAGTKTTDAGGICSPITLKNGKQYSLNTGWTTTLDENENTILARQSELVTAHGHNWGSEHDPTSGSCAPGSILDDGKYLMYPYAVSGEDGNNNKFSSCSINYIKQVLNVKAQSCFSVAEEESACGNGRIDSGEQCDGGYLGKYKLDPCCNSDCTLAAGAICSGSCRDGVCIAFCEYIGRTSCACDNLADSCKRCCRDPNDGNRCKPYNSTLTLSDGRTCIQGYCKSGVCIKTESSLVERFWSLIDKLSFDYVAETFKTNMVAFIQLFSLFLWFPIGCCVWCKDKRSKKKIRRDHDVRTRPDRLLIYDEDRRKQNKPKHGFGRNTLAPLRPMNLRPITQPLTPYYNRPSSAASRTSSSRRNRVVPLPKKVAGGGNRVADASNDGQ
ncbi:hypothetical protein KUTeg_002704 [Tegillarca granosa]|uniref:Uncharacterized protein n=1 Tax=Tegillarca granosa TaxID=220873 RepID=A0ABQ9FYM4_TEGGR|nr:hypothetical protein KUTeg_002704 [Tegillarca granosa]